MNGTTGGPKFSPVAPGDQNHFMCQMGFDNGEY